MSREDYEILKEIGQGSYSKVYEVVHKASKLRFAMKKIDLEKLNSKEKKYTETEIKILSKVSHPSIIKYEKSFEESGVLYIIMELATNGDLQSRINILKMTNGKFELDTIWKYSHQIILGLNALHSNNIVHRDIKATNIFLINENTVKIGDFNIGKFIQGDITSTQIGTPAMMSPEIWDGEPYNYKTDIWSLGCLIYQMATLSHPFYSSNYVTLYTKITNVQYQKNIKNYPPSLTSFIERLLQKDKDLRPSAEELLKLKCFQKFKRQNKSSFVEKPKNDRKNHKSELLPCQRFFDTKKRNSNFSIGEIKKVDRKLFKFAVNSTPRKASPEQRGYSKELCLKKKNFKGAESPFNGEQKRLGCYFRNNSILSQKSFQKDKKKVEEGDSGYGSNGRIKFSSKFMKYSSTPKPGRISSLERLKSLNNI